MRLAAPVPCGGPSDGVGAAAATAGGIKCWTAADAAELDFLVHALVTGYWEHRDRCRACLSRAEPGSLPCPHLRTAIKEVVDWRDARALLSRAEALRAEQNLGTAA